MKRKNQRLLVPELLPASLWGSATKTLSLPPVLVNAYRSLIDRHGLKELANSRDPKDPPVGGLTQELTNKHFAQAFDGSVARAQLAVMDPKRDVEQASNAIIQALSGNHVSITDAPCGAGAAAFAFLATIAELRSRNVLPRLPLDIHLIGAELSDPARKYAEEIFNEIQPCLKTQAIFVEAEFLSWDVTDNLKNTDLIRKMTLSSAKNPKRLLIVANFIGFLEKEGKRKEAEPQIGELFRHASGENSLAIWIEPRMNKAIAEGGLFSWLRKLLKGQWKLFAREDPTVSELRPIHTSEADFRQPINPDSFAIARLALMRLDLVRSK